jgi:hypothetical protein
LPLLEADKKTTKKKTNVRRVFVKVFSLYEEVKKDVGSIRDLS